MNNLPYTQKQYRKVLHFPNPQVTQDLQYLRSSFGVTMNSISQRNQLLEAESQRLKSTIKEYEQIIHAAQNKITEIQKQFQQLKYNVAAKEKCLDLRKLDLDKFQYKCKEVRKNRQTIAQKAIQLTSHQDSKESLEKQIYLKIGQLMKTRISKFMKNIERDHLTVSVKNKIYQFVTQLRCMHPNLKCLIKQREDNKKRVNTKTSIGKIVDSHCRTRQCYNQRVQSFQDEQILNLLMIKKQIEEQGAAKVRKFNAKPYQLANNKTLGMGNQVDCKRKFTVKNSSMYGNLRSSMYQRNQQLQF